MSYNFSEKYSYNWTSKIMLVIGVAMITIVNLILIVILAIMLLRWGRGELIWTNHIGKLMIMIGLLSFFIGIFSNLLPDIQVSNNGLKIQIFFFWWAFVPWEDIVEIRSVLGGLSGSRLIVVRKLTTIHRLIGNGYGSLFKPAFLIKSTINGYDELIHVIRENKKRDM